MTPNLVAFLLGPAAAIGLWKLSAPMRPSRIDTLAWLHSQENVVSEPEPRSLLVEQGTKMSRHLGIASEGLSPQIALLGLTPSRYYLQKATYALIAAGVGLAATVTFGAIGDSSLTLWLLVTALSAPIAFIAPDWFLGRRLENARFDFLTTYAAYLDLVAVWLKASNDNLNTTLIQMSDRGAGVHFDLIRQAIDRSRHANAEPAWEHLRELGERFDLPDIVNYANLCAENSAAGAAIIQTTENHVTAVRKRLTRRLETKSKATASYGVASLLVMFLVLVAFILYGVFATLSDVAVATS